MDSSRFVAVAVCGWTRLL